MLLGAFLRNENQTFLEWLKGLGYEGFALIGALILFTVLFITIIVFFVKMVLKQKRFVNKLESPERHTKVIILNIPRQEYVSFPLRDIEHKTKDTLTHFYGTYSSSERKRMMSWVNSIMSGTNDVPYFQTTIKKKKSHKITRSFLRLVHSDPTTGIIHLESYLIDSTFRVRNARKMLSSESEFAESLRINGSASGMTFCFKLVERNVPTSDKSRNANKIDVEKKFTDYVSRYAVGNQKAISLAPGEVAIANFSFTDLSEGILFALQTIYGITDRITADLRENNKINRHQIKCGIVINKDHLGDSDRILHEASSTVNSIVNAPQPVAIYEKANSVVQTYVDEPEEGFDNEITRILEEKRITYTFRPVYDVKRMRIHGYMARFTPMRTSFGSFAQMKNYAVRTGSLQTLMTAVIKNTIPRFNAERSNKEHRLFFSMRMDEREVILPILSRSRIVKDTNLYLTYLANDIQNSLDSLGVDKFLTQIEDMNKKGVKFAMILKDTVLDLDPRIYAAVDTFFVDLSSEDSFEKDARIRSELHVLVEGLLKYKKPIIANNLTTWNTVEIVVRSGIELISSDMVAPYEKMMKPLNAKSVTKLKFMKEGK